MKRSVENKNKMFPILRTRVSSKGRWRWMRARWYILDTTTHMFCLNHQCTMGAQSTLTFPITHNSLLSIKNFLHRLNKKIWQQCPLVAINKLWQPHVLFWWKTQFFFIKNDFVWFDGDPFSILGGEPNQRHKGSKNCMPFFIVAL